MMDLTITKAAVADAREAVRLIALADEDAVMAISGQATLADALARYEQDFARTDVYFGYENVIVARKGSSRRRMYPVLQGEQTRIATRPLDSQGGEFPRESDDDEIYIDSLAVDPDHRGGGIAKQLVRAVIGQAAAQGFTQG